MTYEKKMIRFGIISMILAIIANFVPAIYMSCVSSDPLHIGEILKIWGLAAATYGVSWFVQVVSYYPTLGATGTYVCWAAGSAADIRMPAAAMSRKAAGVEDGTPEGDVMSTIGVCCSVFVSVAIITVFTILGVKVVSLLPASVKTAFNYVQPALFGAVFFDMAAKNIKLGGSIFALCAILVYALKAQSFIPAGWFVLICVVAAILLGRGFFAMDQKKAAQK